MKTIKLAFYKARYGTLADKIIGWLTGRYSHIEMIFEDGRSYSSSSRDGGTRFKNIKYSTPKQWEFVTFEVTDYQYEDILLYCEVQCGKKYDWMGLLAFYLPVRQSHDKFFCTEIVVRALQFAGLLTPLRASKTTPTMLYEYLKPLSISKSGIR